MTDEEKMLKKKQQKKESAARDYAKNKDKILARNRVNSATYYQRNKGKVAAYEKEYRLANPEKMAEKAKRWRLRNPEDFKSARLKYKYGIDFNEWNKLFEAQSCACAICKTKTPASKIPWHVDHCHSTGKIRGILCHQCNVMIGNARENISILMAAVGYLNQ